MMARYADPVFMDDGVIVLAVGLPVFVLLLCCGVCTLRLELPTCLVRITVIQRQQLVVARLQEHHARAAMTSNTK